MQERLATSPRLGDDIRRRARLVVVTLLDDLLALGRSGVLDVLALLLLCRHLRGLLEITNDVLKNALIEAGAGLRAGSIAIKARKALAEKYGWSSTSASSPASSSVTSAEDKVARLEAELAEMKEKVSSVGHAADASVVAQLQKKVRELDGQRNGAGESSVGRGGLASAMLPASAKDGFSDEMSKDLQQVKKQLAQIEDTLRPLSERAAIEEEERGQRES